MSGGDNRTRTARRCRRAWDPDDATPPIIAQLRKIGLEPGRSFDLDRAGPKFRAALPSAPEEAQKLMSWKIPTLARVVNGWSMNTDTAGVYGNYYLKLLSEARDCCEGGLGR